MIDIQFKLTTTVDANGKITQELEEHKDDGVRTVMQWVADTREESLRTALIELGWTPPA